MLAEMGKRKCKKHKSPHWMEEEEGLASPLKTEILNKTKTKTIPLAGLIFPPLIYIFVQ